jgi:hypothetical protein
MTMTCLNFPFALNYTRTTVGVAVWELQVNAIPDLQQVLTIGNRPIKTIGRYYVLINSDKAVTLLLSNEDFYFALEDDVFGVGDELEFINIDNINNPSLYIDGLSTNIYFNGNQYVNGDYIQLEAGNKAFLKCISVNTFILNIIKQNIPTKTSDLINDGDDGNAFISLLDLPSNLILYPTTAASDISGYVKMVTDIHDPSYNTIAVDVSTGEINTTAQLISSLATSANIINGNPGIFNITTIGNITRTVGSGTAEFYFEIYKRDSLGVETLIAQSNNTIPVVNTGYSEFSATALWDDGSFLATDRIVIKYYANRISGGSNPTYNFQFGGISPVRTLVPIPLNVVPVLPIDAVPTDGSTNAVQSNGVFDALALKANIGVWTDYSNISTIVGFSSFTAKVIRYLQINPKLIMVKGNLSGTSNSGLLNFTIPFTSANNNTNNIASAGVVNSGSGQAAPGFATCNPNSNIVNIFRDYNGLAFTASGTKTGQFTILIEIQ